MFLFFNSDILILLGMLLIFLAPIAAVAWIVYSLVGGNSNRYSISSRSDADEN